jgi:hypothetical protein
MAPEQAAVDLYSAIEDNSLCLKVITITRHYPKFISGRLSGNLEVTIRQGFAGLKGKENFPYIKCIRRS